MKRLIDATCFLVKQELAFWGDDESATSNNRGNYVELLQLLGKFDETLASHLQSSSMFSGLSNRIQNDLIESIAEVVKSNIREEISKVPFVAVEVDESTDISNFAQASLILRYVLNDQVKEAFIGFDDVSGDRTTSTLADYVIKKLENYNCVQKLVA